MREEPIHLPPSQVREDLTIKLLDPLHADAHSLDVSYVLVTLNTCERFVETLQARTRVLVLKPYGRHTGKPFSVTPVEAYGARFVPCHARQRFRIFALISYPCALASGYKSKNCNWLHVDSSDICDFARENACESSTF
ncbi:MAG TPA: hypothetical protein VF584_25370 [Longimicrobium sp.]